MRDWHRQRPPASRRKDRGRILLFPARSSIPRQSNISWPTYEPQPKSPRGNATHRPPELSTLLEGIKARTSLPSTPATNAGALGGTLPHEGGNAPQDHRHGRPDLQREQRHRVTVSSYGLGRVDEDPKEWPLTKPSSKALPPKARRLTEDDHGHRLGMQGWRPAACPNSLSARNGVRCPPAKPPPASPKGVPDFNWPTSGRCGRSNVHESRYSQCRSERTVERARPQMATRQHPNGRIPRLARARSGATQNSR